METLEKIAQEAKTECIECGKDITDLGELQVSPVMRYVPRIHCTQHHNLWILGDITAEDYWNPGYAVYPVGEGWMPILRKLNEDLEKLHPGYLLTQVKEKFGVLRVYTDNLPIYKEEARKRAEEVLNAAKEGREPEDWAKVQSEVREDDYTEGYLLICDAEGESAETCEMCGEPGELRTEGRTWIRTLCETHDEETRRGD